MEFFVGFIVGAGVASVAAIALPKVRDVFGNIQRSHAVAAAKAVVAAEEARLKALEAARQAVAAAAVVPPPAPPNPLAPKA